MLNKNVSVDYWSTVPAAQWHFQHSPLWFPEELFVSYVLGQPAWHSVYLRGKGCRIPSLIPHVCCAGDGGRGAPRRLQSLSDVLLSRLIILDVLRELLPFGCLQAHMDGVCLFILLFAICILPRGKESVQIFYLCSELFVFLSLSFKSSFWMMLLYHPQTGVFLLTLWTVFHFN